MNNHTNEITIYRVRKSPNSIKSQKGAFFLFCNAVKRALETKCNIYNNKGDCIWDYKYNITKTEENKQ